MTEALVVLVLDESGSMLAIKDSTISTVNEYVDSIAKDHPDCDFLLTRFNNGPVLGHRDQAGIKVGGMEKVTHFNRLDSQTYQPYNGTPLYDAIAKTASKVDDYGKTYDKVLFVIMTDGEENSSLEYTKVAIKKLIEEHTNEQNWDFVYLGANQDAFTVGAGIGIFAAASYQASNRGMGATSQSINSTTSGYLAGAMDAVEISLAVEEANEEVKKEETTP